MLKFELSPEMIAVVGQALEQMPYRMAAPVIAELQKQINAQQQPQASPDPAPQSEG